MNSIILKKWWIEALKGFIAILIGIVAFANPQEALVLIATYIGIITLIIGIVLVVVSFIRKGRHWQFWLVEGVFDAIVGILIIANPEISVSILVVFISIFIIVMGIIQLTVYNRLKEVINRRGIILFSSITSLLFGIIFLFNPFEVARFMVIALGIYAMIYGVTSLYLSYKLSRI